MSNITRNELATAIRELAGTEWEVKDVESFLNDCETYEVPLDDIAWFLWYDFGALMLLDRYAFKWGGYFEIFPDWDAYLAEDFECYDDDPYQPLDAYVVVDAGLSGVYYIQTYSYVS